MKAEAKIVGIILAAGASTRFGRPKQLVRFKGKRLLEWVLDAALPSELHKVVLVLGHARTEIKAHLAERLAHPKLVTVINRDYRRGQSSSMRLGLKAAGENYSAVMFLLADQPFIQTAAINRLIASFRRSPKGICVPAFEGRRGNPVMFGSAYFEALSAVEGDFGGRELIGAYPQDVLEVRIENPLAFADIDTPDDLARLNALKG